MSEWPKYRTEKIIQAAEIKAIHNDFGQGEYFLWVDPGTGTLEKFTTTVAGMMDKAEVGGFALLYPDGFRSVIPKQTFEETATKIDG